MKIQKKYLGTKMMHPINKQYFLIEEGKEDLYLRLGFDIFVRPRKPKLEKKKDVKDTKRRDNKSNNDSNGANND